jgi:hypothetical protein
MELEQTAIGKQRVRNAAIEELRDAVFSVRYM